MDQLGIERDDDAEVSPDEGSRVFEATPSLTFTKAMTATINGKSLQNPNWASILLTMLAQVKAKGFEGERLVRELAVPCKARRFEEDGYWYFPELEISVQGQSAAEAWKEVDRLVKKLGIPVTIEFAWRQNPKAQHPGKTGVLRSGKV